MIIDAKSLRTSTELQKIPDISGWYKWWAKEDTARKLLGHFFGELLPVLTKGTGELNEYYYLYVGIDNSMRKRLNWHINQQHTAGYIKNGFLSTFRNSIASLIANDLFAETETNNIIDTFKIEYFPMDIPKKEIEATIEIPQMGSNVLPINIQNNHNPRIQEFTHYLKEQRANSRQKALLRIGSAVNFKSSFR
ncbi:hypothetical protein AGMMS4952_09450 [Spirochaetia bacterium]|nr:hypothetical protein AGMMS4952_09450 [Spirochaetia bacterium]